MEYNWSILKDGSELTSNLGNYAILVLNRPIKINPTVVSTLWNKASWRITIDGGTDAWFDFIKAHNLSLPLPHQVTGDFDSIKPETLAFCKEQQDIDVVETPDQDYTDFNKALKCLFQSYTEKLDCFVVLLDHSGRLDQTFSNLNTLAEFEVPGYLLSPSSLTWLLKPGKHLIDIPLTLREKSEWCGILPFNAGKIISTGLKWNLDNWTVEFGGLISSSNTYDGSPVVSITTDKTVIWTMSAGSLFV